MPFSLTTHRAARASLNISLCINFIFYEMDKTIIPTSEVMVEPKQDKYT